MYSAFPADTLLHGWRRFSVYDPGPDALASFGAAWLGWDARAGCDVAPLGGAWTQTPRRYGFHATIKAPFRLAEGRSPEALAAAFDALCGRLAPVTMPPMTLSETGGFLALRPEPQPRALTDLAATVVQEIDDFRSPPTEAEIARRNPGRLSASQRGNLARWGYPHVFDDFHYHMTLTGTLGADERAEARAMLLPLIGPLVGEARPLDSLALMGEDADGRFHLLRRRPLGR